MRTILCALCASVLPFIFLTAQPSRAAAFLPEFEKIPATVITADIVFWDGENAVEQYRTRLDFDRAQGWHAQKANQYGQYHAWKDASGCHQGEWSDTNGLAGELRRADFAKCEGQSENGLSLLSAIDFSATLLRMLGVAGALPDPLFGPATCKPTATGFACKSANGDAALLDLEQGLPKQIVFRRAQQTMVQTIQIGQTRRAVTALERAPDFKSAGLLPGHSEADMRAIFRRALGGESLALRHSMLLLTLEPGQLKANEIFQLLEMAYAAKLPGAHFTSAQLYSKPWRQNLPPEALKRGEKALVAEFAKRMTDAAMDCNVDAIKRMEEGCFELDCENDTPKKATALLSYRQSQACETKRLNRFKHLKRPIWANRVLP